MATKLIRLEDGTLVEAEVDESQARPISSSAAERVAASMTKIEPILVSICQPVARAWQAMAGTLEIESAELELGLSFEGEGNVFVSKATAGANLTVRLTVKRPGAQTG